MVNTRKQMQTNNNSLTTNSNGKMVNPRKQMYTNNNNLTFSDFTKKKCVVRIKRMKFDDINERKNLQPKSDELYEVPSQSRPEKKDPAPDIVKKLIKEDRKKSVVQVKRMKFDDINEKEENREPKSDDLYEFSSQSSPEKKDPAFDIVKKLIKEGKAVVSRKKVIKSKSTKTSKCPLFMQLEGTKRKRGRPPKLFNRENKPASVKIDAKPSTKTKDQNNITENFVIPVNDTITTRPPSIMDKKKLALEARKIVMQSTPVMKKSSVHQHINVSPILNKSPWRPTDETLPRFSYVSKSSDQLPSYSSDVIPFRELDEVPRQPRFSADLSNIENISPNKSSDKTEKQDFTPRFRATQGTRNPLSKIQILEVVKLPNYAPIVERIAKKLPRQTNTSLLSLSKKNSAKILATAQQKNDITNNNQSLVPDNQNSSPIINPQDFSIENCFGFNESLSDDKENSSVFANEDSNVFPKEDSLRTKLKALERLIPPKSSRTRFEQTPSIFATEAKQQDIRQMLSSTDTAQDDENKEKSLNITEESGNLSLNKTEELHLFDDLKPQTSFNSSAGLRTYSRTPRKTRKRTKQFLLFNDLSESEDEPEGSPKRKKRKKGEDKKNTKELNKFVEEFNSMCEEVDQYTLQIERAKDEDE